jgi:hypothetical protein
MTVPFSEAEEDYKQEWDTIRYSVHGKMLALDGYILGAEEKSKS